MFSSSRSNKDNFQDDPTEHALKILKTRTLGDYEQAVYIPPLAKPSLQAKDENLFPLMEKIEGFLASECQVMLILGDSGAGKTIFNRHLEHQLWQKYQPGGVIPLFINLPTLDRPDKHLVAEQLKTLDFSDELIWDLKENRHFVLICDGYDESQLTVNLHTTNLFNRPGHWRVKLVISCRTQYLGRNHRDQFVPKQSNQYQRAANNLFQEAIIVPFTRHQIEDYVEKYVPLEPRTWVKADYMDKLTTTPGLLGLVENPFLLTLCLEALPSVIQDQSGRSRLQITRTQLFDSFVAHWLEVNKLRLHNQKLSAEDQGEFDELKEDGFEQSVIDFQQGLAAAIFTHQDGRPIVEYTPKNDKNSWKAAFFNSEPRKALLRHSSLLTRMGNQHRFIHRSVMEYFYSCAICPPPACADECGPQVRFDSTNALASIANHPLSQRSLVTEPSIIQFLVERVQTVPEFKGQLHVLIERSKTEQHASHAASNAITILINGGVRFNGADLRGVKIPGADLSGGQFNSAQFQGAILTGANLAKSWIWQTDFSEVTPSKDTKSSSQVSPIPLLVNNSSQAVWTRRYGYGTV
ncbi:hypothetical protein BGZ96_010193 [Linnemannia gamsii]|uniref:NACHT domain-containing protein n=1 Tax=Linnemannia gamsii TaxID=64522 RepID=A0ABQ7JUN1_9FUNG|nr:hypothetical protein BGZ96_010193 [Linnemannia gamsii]